MTTVECKPPILLADKADPENPKYYYWHNGKLEQMNTAHAELLIWTGESKERRLADEFKPP